MLIPVIHILVKLKTIYDQFGEDVLREGVKDEKGRKFLINS
jgi:hypothetical protein